MTPAQLADALADRVDSVVPALLPKANKIRGYWVVGSVDGEEGGSLFIHATGKKCGQWSDAATNQHGDLLDLVREARRVSVSGACRWTEEFLGVVGQDDVSQQSREERARRQETEDRKRRECALGIWRETRVASGSLVEIYLKVRGISLPVPASIRFHSSLKHSGTGLYLPAMVAGICGLDRRVTAIHRTFLAEPGRKAGVSSNKMALGPLGAGGARLAAAGDVLGLAEGIETGLSAMQLFQVPVWCACGSWLERIAVPDTVLRVVIFADRGPPGKQAAEKVARLHRDAGREVDVRFPTVGKDFNDQLQAQGAERAA